ncbi:MAG TPA: enoyl-CoA hydratase-related protein [Thermomicrobiaceae bacterium]|nr:enoyl-CoA hydratase-related protein [Thermomicrobiaceae bacterium]
MVAGEILRETRADGAIGLITLNRPERHNALNLAMWQELAAGVRALGADPATRVIVLRGAGEKAFASGADLHELATFRQTPEGAAAFHDAVEAAFAALAAVEQPVIAMIHGYCIGGGCELAVACDLRVADERARFGIPATKLGIVLGVDELRRLANLVGLAVAKEILFTSRHLDAGEALGAGLVNQVVPAAELEETVFGLARQIAANDPSAVAAAKSLLDALGRDMPADELLELQRSFVERARQEGESQQRINAVVNRR